jgi:hypothetical protein
VASNDLGWSLVISGRSHVASRGCGWPCGSGVALGVTDGLVGLQMASGAAGGLVGSWVAIRGRRCPLGVPEDTNYRSNLLQRPQILDSNC